VSYDGSEGVGTVTADRPLPGGIGETIEALILGVARGSGIASPRTFSRQRAEWMIAKRQASPSAFKNEHEEAALLERLLNEQPDLFWSAPEADPSNAGAQ
jgi:hypothetical protein